jgi:hypothetical protein
MLSGCTTPLFGAYGANGQSREEFSSYVESVFRLQNAMTSEIMALQGIDEVTDHVALYQADQGSSNRRVRYGAFIEPTS